eukprot:scaffold18668_cov164-Amphora_coffeaeformis.AAC.3
MSSSMPPPAKSKDDTIIQPVVVVVGASGRVGRHVVEQLLDQNVTVRAVVRNVSKAEHVLPTSSSLLHMIQADVGHYDNYADVLDKTMDGSSSIISVMGAVRFSKITDWLPWRIFSKQATWADRSHPYYGNYLGQKYLLELAEKHNVSRFVRLTGLGLAHSPFHPFAILFNTLLSFNNRWGLFTEQAMYQSTVPTLVLRPGGLTEEERDTVTTNVQVDVSGKLPYPGRIGRNDVAALAVAAVTLAKPELLPSKLTLACRWCGTGVKPRPQGTKEQGHATALECLTAVAQAGESSPAPLKSKPYGVAVALTVYTAAFLAYKLSKALFYFLKRVVKALSFVQRIRLPWSQAKFGSLFARHCESHPRDIKKRDEAGPVIPRHAMATHPC